MNKSMTALITGASSGIGLELATVMAKAGHELVLCARSKEKLEAIARELKDTYGTTVHVRVADLSKPDVVTQLCNDLDAQQINIDILVNNAGFGDFGLFVEADWEKLKTMVNLNILALTELAYRFAPAMVQRGYGYIMNVASTAAFQPGPWMSVYYASKAYVLSFSESINYELRSTGVTATALCPGATESGFQNAADMQGSKLLEGKRLPSSAEVAVYGYQAMLDKKAVAIHGRRNWLMAQSVRLAPRAIVLKMVDALSRKK